MLDFAPRKVSIKVRYEQEGLITATVQPGKSWRVSHEATEWSARSTDAVNFEPGDSVRIVGRISATTLLIAPV